MKRGLSTVGFLLMTTWVVARTIHVPSEAPSIQAGLDSLLNGDTVWVARGMYHELLIGPAMAFTMIGEFLPDSADAARPFVLATSVPGADTTPVLILPHGCRATIVNIKFQNGPQGGASLHYRRGIRSQADSVTLRNCIVDSTAWSFREEPDSIGSPNHGAVVLDHCEFRHCVGIGVIAYSPRAIGCVFTGLDTVTLELAGSADSSDYDSCVFRDGYGAIALWVYGQGVNVSHCTFGPTGPAWFEPIINLRDAGGRFVNNQLRDCLYGSGAVYLESDSPRVFELSGNTFVSCVGIDAQAGAVINIHSTYGGDEANAFLVSDNIFLDNEGSFFADDIAVFRGDGILAGNRFVAGNENDLPAVQADSSWPWMPVDSVIMRDNLFEDCGFAASGPATLDARDNWWGDATGPYHADLNPLGLGDTVVGSLQFDPWHTDTSFLATPDTNPLLPQDWQLFVYPNPFNSSVRIILAGFTGTNFEITLHNLLGQIVDVVHRGPLTGGGLFYTAPAYLASGVYFLKASDRHQMFARKVVLMK